ncbi:MAG TPA: FG-GAP-like repeat-containing protein, partial [Candidatus Paceibacterota bacterium]|nr:FG-GAP-like repeat-containing protein [Candidatus Paceibacterota bacterium]
MAEQQYSSSTGCHTSYALEWTLGNPVQGIAKGLVKTASILYNPSDKLRLGDFNGDTYTDVLVYHGDGSLSWYLGDGQLNFTKAQVSGLPDKLDYSGQLQVVDWNGDGLSDLFWNDRNSHHNAMYLNTGKLHFDTVQNMTPPQEEGWYFFGDWNGDGITDLLWFHNDTGSNVWYLHDGNGGFQTVTNPIDRDSWGSSHHDGQLLFGDWNGDGITDVMWYEPDNGYNQWFINDGHLNFFNHHDDPIDKDSVDDGSGSQVGDWNGDGITDWVLYKGGHEYRFFTNQGTAGADQLIEVQNGLGATTAIEYTPSSAWPDSRLPVDSSLSVLSTVSALTTQDGQGNASTTRYQYAGAAWSTAERRFLGFRQVIATLNDQGDTLETYYYQKEGTVAKVETRYWKDKTGAIYRYEHNDYQDSASAPYSSLLVNHWVYQCNLTTTCRRLLTGYTYDIYGNTLRIDHYGDYDETGDERITQWGYQANTQDYIVSLPAYRVDYGLNSDHSSQRLAETLYTYDHQTSYDSPPVNGLLTTVEHLLFSDCDPTGWHCQTNSGHITHYQY